MAKIADRDIYRKAKSGDILNFKTTVTVNSKGVFFMTIPEILEPVASGLDINSFPYRNGFRITGETLKEVESNLDQIIKEFLMCEKSTALVILYDYTTKCHYVKTDQGHIYPNGSYDPSYKWVGSMDNFSRADDYVVGIRAKIVTKITYKSKDKERIEYSSVYDDSRLGEFGKKLNDFVKVAISERNPKELPYTEKTAKLFYDAMIGLCTLSEKLDCALSEPQKILTASSLLLPER